MNLVSFRDFLELLSCLLPELHDFAARQHIASSLRTYYVFMSFPPRWKLTTEELIVLWSL